MVEYVSDRSIYQVPTVLLDNAYFYNNLKCFLDKDKMWEKPEYVFVFGRTLNRFLGSLNEIDDTLAEKIISSSKEVERNKDNLRQVVLNSADTISLFESKIYALTEMLEKSFRRSAYWHPNA